MAASHKVEKYLDLGARYIFEPVAIETLGIFNASARHLLNDLVRRITLNLGEARDKLPVSKDLDISASMLSFYMTVCRLLTARIEDRTCFSYIFHLIFKIPRDYITEGKKNNNNNNNNNKVGAVQMRSVGS